MKCTAWSRSGPLGPTDNEFRSLGAGAPAPVVDPVSGRGSEVAMLHRVPEPTRTQAPTGPRTQICRRQSTQCVPVRPQILGGSGQLPGTVGWRRPRAALMPSLMWLDG